MLYSNDKSSVKLFPANHKAWFYDSNLITYSSKISHIFSAFFKFVEKKAKTVRIITKRDKKSGNYFHTAEIVFPYFSISQRQEKPFGIYVHFNYIEYKNKAGFNYIKESTEYNQLKDFVTEIVYEYICYLEEFVEFLNKDMETTKYVFGRNDVLAFVALVINEYKKTKNIGLNQLSVTCDIHFVDTLSKAVFFNVISRIRKESYKTMIVDDETVFFYPYNHNIEQYDKSLPKVRFYDKQKDTLYRYFLKKKKGDHILLTSSVDEFSMLERFECIDIASQELKDLNSECAKAMNLTKDTLRFELEYSKKAVKRAFLTSNFYDININNMSYVNSYLVSFLDNETTSYKELLFHDTVSKEKQIANVSAKINAFSESGQISEYFNFVIKEHEFLNRISHGNVSGDEVTAESIMQNENSATKVAIYHKISRFRKKGILHGRGKNVCLNEPYRSLLDIFNLYHYYNLLKEKVVISPITEPTTCEAGLGSGYLS
jgi:hypothetical protein